jgi:hypothetical protein
VLCFSFTDLGKRELRKREKEKKKKEEEKKPRLSDPATSCSPLVNRQAYRQQMPVPVPGCYAP